MATLFENYITGDDTAFGLQDPQVEAQTFTPSASHDITSVKLLFYRAGSPGTITVSIRATDGSGHPTGSDLASGTTDGDTLPTASPYEWREITFGTPLPLVADTKYAIVVDQAIAGGGGQQVIWRADGSSPSYAGGNHEQSSDNGASFAAGTQDFMFEDWGDLLTAPTVTTGAIQSTGTTTAIVIGNVTDLGSDNPSAFGHAFNTTGQPVVGDNNVDLGAKSATGRYHSYITDLTPGTQYFFRAYATNSAGTSYGAEVQATPDTYYLYIIDKHLKYKDRDRVERTAVAADLIVTYEDELVLHEDNIVFS